MKIGIVGGSGFIGSYVTKVLFEQGHQVIKLTRPLVASQSYLDLEVVINLAGETINQRWTKEAKQRILHSRVETTKQLLDLMENKHMQPKLFINASAIGYYGTSLDHSFTEKDASGDDFLAQVTLQWEKEAMRAAQWGIRVVITRFGVVLGKGGGALPRMVLPYKYLVGGPIGTGQQWVSWVHLQDVVGIILFAIENQRLEGPINVTAPEPVRMSDFGKTIGNVLHRPHWLPAPAFALRLMLGEMSDLILKGQRVLPQKVLKEGYQFKFPHLREALLDAL